MVPVRVDPLLQQLGTAGGHRLVLLSLEVHEDWADLRFARSETPGAPPLPRRVPHARAWTILVDGVPATVVDAVGRGDRAFSNGEVRLRPPPPAGARLAVTVQLAADEPALAAEFDLPTPPATARDTPVDPGGREGPS
jgi:hypothetical protein